MTWFWAVLFALSAVFGGWSFWDRGRLRERVGVLEERDRARLQRMAQMREALRRGRDPEPSDRDLDRLFDDDPGPDAA